MIVAVTGANGFVGRYVIRALEKAKCSVRALVRTTTLSNIQTVSIPSLNAAADVGALRGALQGADIVVHLAAHVHMMKSAEEDDVFVDINVGGTCRLFEAAAAAGVKRFVFISSVKAVAERSEKAPLTDDTPARPEDAYGRSKRAAELELLSRSEKPDTPAVVILRPTFVYGWPPTGNFATLIRAVRYGIPLPFDGINNRRDMLYVENLADAIREACITETVGPGPYFICDGHPVSTTALFQETARAFGRRARLFSIPDHVLRAIGTFTGRQASISRLLEDFQVDGAPFRRDAAWQPPYKLAEGLTRCATAARVDREIEDANTP